MIYPYWVFWERITKRGSPGTCRISKSPVALRNPSLGGAVGEFWVGIRGADVQHTSNYRTFVFVRMRAYLYAVILVHVLICVIFILVYTCSNAYPANCSSGLGIRCTVVKVSRERLSMLLHIIFQALVLSGRVGISIGINSNHCFRWVLVSGILLGFLGV